MTTTRRVSAALAAITLVAVGVMPLTAAAASGASTATPASAHSSTPSTAPAPRASSTYTSISPSRAVNNKQVKAGKRATFSFAGVAELRRSGIQRIRAVVSISSAARGSVVIAPRAGSTASTVRFKARKSKSASVALSPGDPVGWTVRNRAAKSVRVTITVTGYWSAGSGTNTIPPVDPPSRTTDSSPGPIGSGGRYDVGAYSATDIWVDPLNGNDARSGNSRGDAKQTIAAAWDRIPDNQTLSTGYRIQLVAGTYAADTMPNYWENRLGTYAHPIILNAADGAHTAQLLGDINMFNTRYFYLTGADIIRDGDAFHCEQCSYTLIRGSHLDGDATAGGDLAHETLKVNQSDHFYVEDSIVAGADDNAIDFVAVQYGHLRGNRVSHAVDWCAYSKGGSAYLTVAENEFYDCGTGGYTAGQGTGFEFTTSPWIYYEAMDIKVVNNIIHDTEGAGLGVNGGYNILMAYNTMYRVGQRSHVVEFVFGGHSCDGDTARCASRVSAGGWGTSGSGEAIIPNKHVYFYNNVVLNPAGYQSQWQQFAIYGPRSQPSGAANAPDPATTDSDLRIVGNVVWNGDSSMPLGVGAGEGCLPSNPTCNETQLLAGNRINTTRPDFVGAAALNFEPTPGGWLAGQPGAPIPDFAWSDSPNGSIPAGRASNAVPTNRAGDDRGGWGHPGAY